MIVVAVVAGTMMFIAAVLAVIRIGIGPSMLDRTIALDVFTATLVGVIALEAAWHKRTDTIPILVVLSMVGFVGSVAIARFASVEPPDEARIRSREEINAEARAIVEAEAQAHSRAQTPERFRATAEDSEHHGGAADGLVR